MTSVFPTNGKNSALAVCRLPSACADKCVDFVFFFFIIIIIIIYLFWWVCFFLYKYSFFLFFLRIWQHGKKYIYMNGKLACSIRRLPYNVMLNPSITWTITVNNNYVFTLELRLLPNEPNKISRFELLEIIPFTYTHRTDSTSSEVIMRLQALLALTLIHCALSIDGKLLHSLPFLFRCTAEKAPCPKI